ncbi:MAG: DUF1801 domain-containing protein [Chloracidobacterium sp.]|nr:DUF1801 domain-containing protein [Chloracidobacterium sp.]
MQYDAKTPDEYIAGLPEDRKLALTALRKVINENLPDGFKETMGYGHMGWVVPHKTYPAGYHCDPSQPLPFMGIASQKKSYRPLFDVPLWPCKTIEWFRQEWPKHSKKKLNMGKSCIRFTKLEDIPLDLIGELASKVTPQQWIEIYEKALKR